MYTIAGLTGPVSGSPQPLSKTPGKEANIFHFHITTTKRPCLSPLGPLLLPSFCDVHRRPQGPTEKLVAHLYKFTKPRGRRLLAALAAAYATDRPGAWMAKASHTLRIPDEVCPSARRHAGGRPTIIPGPYAAAAALQSKSNRQSPEEQRSRWWWW